jgi:DNA-binding CsgD family transcriptional regulator
MTERLALAAALDPPAENSSLAHVRTANRNVPTLTPRQRDCVLLVARGNSDEEIARTLGISRLTAHKHVEAAKKRYGVTTRVRLVVDALFANELSFAAIFAADRLLAATDGQPASR